MRDIPGLNQGVFDRAANLAQRAEQAKLRFRGAVPSDQAPRASMAPAKVVDGVARIRLYDVIDPEGGYWGNSAGEFADVLDELAGDVTGIELHVNSPGGAVWDGLTILNSLRQHPAPVTAVVDGIAASAASFIAVACDEVVMMPNSRLMIHDALGICLGQAVDMRAYADFLDDTSDNIAEIYASKAGGTTEEWRQTMVAKGFLGEWYSAEQAVDAGLADRVGGTETGEPVDAAKTSGQPTLTGLQERKERMQARRAGRLAARGA